MSNRKNLDAEWNDSSSSIKEDLVKKEEKSRDKEARKLSPSAHKMDVDKRDSKKEKSRETSRHESKSKKDRRDSRDRHRRHRHDDKKDRKKHRSSSRSSSGSRRRDRRSSKDRKRDDEKNHSKHRSRSRSRSRDYQRERRDNRYTDEKKAMEILKKIEIPKEIKSDRKQVVQYQADELKKKAEEISGVKIPSFYNTSAVNPLTLAEQQRKRKLLWSKSKDNENTSTKMIGKAIIEGQDEKTAEKFRKLMGIKSLDELKDVNTVDKIHTMQKQAFDDMDKEYEYARMTTHLNRGKGLGFASHTANLLLDANQRLQFQ